MRKYIKPIFVSALLVSITVLCVAVTAINRRDRAEIQDKTVTASFYPVYVCALNIADGVPGVGVVNLTGNLTGCPHEYQITPEDLKVISKSDLLVTNGLEMEEFLENSLANFPNLKVADLCARAGIEGKSEESDEDEHEHEHEHEHEEGHHHVNGHVWTNPDLYLKQIDAMAGFLAENDTENAQKYYANAESYKQRVIDAAQNLPKNLAGRKVIVFHDSLEYLCDYMGLEVVMAVEMDTDVPLSAATVAQAVKTAKENGVSMILCEKQFSDSAAASVAKEAGIPFIVLDSGVSGDGGKDGYINMIAENVERFKRVSGVE